MTNLQVQRDIRAKFYNSPSVMRHISANGAPRSMHAFMDMVALGTSENLDSVESIELISCLGNVVFTKHPQQINVMDKSNGRTITSIRR